MANVERYSWNVQINGVVYLVEYMKGSVYINGGEAFKNRSLEYKRKFIPSRMSYTVPLAGKVPAAEACLRAEALALMSGREA